MHRRGPACGVLNSGEFALPESPNAEKTGSKPSSGSGGHLIFSEEPDQRPSITADVLPSCTVLYLPASLLRQERLIPPHATPYARGNIFLRGRRLACWGRYHLCLGKYQVPGISSERVCAACGGTFTALPSSGDGSSALCSRIASSYRAALCHPPAWPSSYAHRVNQMGTDSPGTVRIPWPQDCHAKKI